MKNNKITAVYARTSSKKQNFVLQIEAASPYLKGIEPENLFYFVDEGVSGSSQPVELQKLLDLIRNDQIDTLVVYDRSRLTTSVETYLQLINLIDRHQVRVIFAATGHNYRLVDIYTEGLNVLMKKIEGINLSNRIKEGKKRKNTEVN
ncbi:recombinase family protein [Rossellomorea aquimaris]|nr:recombinase family protein [Rossellomorea aquimaris]WRP06587.1 recombinase family protein [Rossellomorea aquimaris]